MLQGYDDARDHVFSAVEPDDIVRVWQPVQPVGALVAVLYMAEDGLAKLQQGPVGKCQAGCVRVQKVSVQSCSRVQWVIGGRLREGCMGQDCMGESVPAAQCCTLHQLHAASVPAKATSYAGAVRCV